MYRGFSIVWNEMILVLWSSFDNDLFDFIDQQKGSFTCASV